MVIEKSHCKNKKEYNVLIIYDITDNKRRNKVNKFLESFGYRIQRSAFECCLTIYEFDRMMKKIKNMIDEKQDFLKIFRFTELTKVISVGEMKEVKTIDLTIL